MIMTEQEIVDAGIDYTMEHNPVCIAGDAFYEQARQLNRNRNFEAGAKWALSQSGIENNITKECISVNDRLPDKSGFYFGFSDDGCIPCILVYDKEENYIDIVIALMGSSKSKVSHWIDAPVKAGEWK